MHTRNRPAVDRFADRVNRQIDDGAEGQWQDKPTTELLAEVGHHLAELKRAHELLLGGVTSPEMYEEVAVQAERAAAHLMMISDNVTLGRKKAVLT